MEEIDQSLYSDLGSLNLSTSVEVTADRLSTRELIGAAPLVNDILERHSEYGDGIASQIYPINEEQILGDRRSVDEWLNLVRMAFDPELVSMLDGRLVIVGLSLLDRGLRRELQENNFLNAVEEEVKRDLSVPIDDLLTEWGRALREPDDSVQNQRDAPLKRIDADQLSRAPFAGYLAERIISLPRSRSGAYAIHLYGPWGSGKSTILNFLREELLQHLQIRLSPVLENFEEGRTVSAGTLASNILEAEQDQGTPDIPIDKADIGGESKQVQSWFRAVRSLFDIEHAPELTGALIVVGLSILEPKLRWQLQAGDVLSDLEQELGRPLDDLLTAEGQQRRRVADWTSDYLETKRDFTEDQSIGAGVLVNSLLETWGKDYANGIASNFRVSIADTTDYGPERTVDEWLEEVRLLFDRDLAPELHGRLVIVGLSLLNPEIRSQLQENGFLAALEAEMHESLDEVLTPEGREKWKEVNAEMRTGSIADEDAERTEDRSQSPEEVASPDETDDQHKKLDSDDQEWLVIEFNAWRHHHIRPPWWALMDHVFQESKDELSFFDRLREYGWRLASGHLAFYAVLTLLAWLLAVGLLLFGPSGTDGLTFIQSASQFLAALVTIGSVWQATSKSLLFGSSEAAADYVASANDPMDNIEEKFTRLIERNPKRVAIFIDDLDRCKSTYVVELLEGIQTLFRGPPVVFIIAADQRWLNTCFEEEYKDYMPTVHEPGKPLGMLFREKVFQSSVPVPGIPEDIQTTYFESLIGIESVDEETPSAKESANEETPSTKGTTRVMNAKTEGELLQILDESDNLSVTEQRATREAIVRRLAVQEVFNRTEHVLKPFAPLLEPNPRAMKLLVNNYSVNRALATLTDVEIGRNQLALWTILSIRWPAFASYLKTDPSLISQVGQSDVDGVDPEFEPLFTEPEVISVVRPPFIDDELTEEAMELCASLHA